MNKVIKIVLLGFLPILSAGMVLAQGGALNLISKTGRLRIDLSDADGGGSYRESINNIGGKLYFKEVHESARSMTLKFQFRDTFGQERCHGRMILMIRDQGNYRAQKIDSRWEVDGKIPGYDCTAASSVVTVEDMLIDQ